MGRYYFVSFRGAKSKLSEKTGEPNAALNLDSFSLFGVGGYACTVERERERRGAHVHVYSVITHMYVHVCGTCAKQFLW